jgi:cytochrome c553
VYLRSACSLLALLVLPFPLLAASPAAQEDYQEAVARTADAARGARLYVTCAGCHRQNGRGNLDGSVPLIAGQHPLVTVKQLTDYRHAQRWDPRMQIYADNHVLADTQAIADVAAHVAVLERKGAGGTGPGDRLEQGRRIYAASCASCHGPAGEGNPALLAPRIAGQHYNYLLRLFRDATEGTRPNFDAGHVQLLKRIGEQDLAALADALARMD